MNDRLPTDIIVSALLRRVNDDGGIGVVLGKGDAHGGAILVVIADRRGSPKLLERGFDRAGKLVLIDSTPTEADDSAVDSYWKRRRGRDPDLWVIELDSPSGERFAAETILGD